MIWLLGATLALGQEPDAKGMARASELVSTGSGARWALVVGVDRYEDEGIETLKFPAADARAVARALIESGAYPADHVVLMTPDQDDERLRPTRNHLEAEIGNLSLHSGADTILFYYSGHGAAGTDGERTENYLLPQDVSLNHLADTAIGVGEVIADLQRSGAPRRYIVFDACRNNLIKASKGTPPAWEDEQYGLSQGSEVLYCSQFGSYSFEDPASRHGLCTAALLEGLEGKADGRADQPRDEVIGSKELYSYVEERLSPRQIPSQATIGEQSGPGFALAPVPRWPSQTCPAKADQVRRSIDAAVALCSDPPAFPAAWHAAADLLGCLDEPASDVLAADWHRLSALYALHVHDTSGAVKEMSAVRALLPGQDPRTDIPASCWNPILGRQPDSGTSARRAKAIKGVPPKVTVHVDGRPSPSRPADRAALVQPVYPNGTVDWTRVLPAEDRLPPIHPAPTLARRQVTGLGLGVGAGTAALLSGGLLVAGLATRGELEEQALTLQSADPAPLADLEALRARANRLGYASQGSAVVALGLGTAAVLTFAF